MERRNNYLEPLIKLFIRIITSLFFCLYRMSYLSLLCCGGAALTISLCSHYSQNGSAFQAEKTWEHLLFGY